MLHFHISLHARVPSAGPGPTVEVDGVAVPTLTLREAFEQAAFDCTFEAAAERLSQLPRMHCEPDGSLVWRSENDSPPWQVDGNLYDRAEHSSMSSSTAAARPKLLTAYSRALGWPEQQVMFRLVRQAGYLSTKRPSAAVPPRNDGESLKMR